MRPKISKTVREAFALIITKAFPCFQKLEGKDLIYKGSCVFRCEVSKNFFLFIDLQFHDYEDRFTINIGWCNNEYLFTKKHTNESEYEQFRLDRLLEDREKGGFWWSLFNQKAIEKSSRKEVFLQAQRLLKQREEEYIAKTLAKEVIKNEQKILKEEVEAYRALAADAFDCLVKYGFPYFENIIKSKGYESPLSTTNIV